MSEKKVYLGDGVYIDVDDWNSIILTTENGIEATNRIVLEPSLIINLMDYITRVYPSKADTKDLA